MARDELGRVLYGPEPDQQPSGMLDHFTVRCHIDAQMVLERTKQVLALVLAHSSTPWPSDGVWRSVLPAWFIAQSAPEPSQTESDQWLRSWRKMPRERQVLEEESRKWSVNAFTSWFRPEDRSWYWWNAHIEGMRTLRIVIQIDGWPYAYGALRWLLRASGAETVQRDNEM